MQRRYKRKQNNKNNAALLHQCFEGVKSKAGKGRSIYAFVVGFMHLFVQQFGVQSPVRPIKVGIVYHKKHKSSG